MAKDSDKKQLPVIVDKRLEERQKRYQELVEMCLKIINQPNFTILFITDLVAYLPISRQTFYNYELDKSDAIIEAINKSKISVKTNLRADWITSKNPILQLALYKLIATDEERNILNNKQVQTTNNDVEINCINGFDITKI